MNYGSNEFNQIKFTASFGLLQKSNSFSNWTNSPDEVFRSFKMVIRHIVEDFLDDLDKRVKLLEKDGWSILGKISYCKIKMEYSQTMEKGISELFPTKESMEKARND